MEIWHTTENSALSPADEDPDGVCPMAISPPGEAGSLSGAKDMRTAHGGAHEPKGAQGLRGLGATDELQALRSLLFKKEIAAIEALESRLNDHRSRAEEVSAVVAEALLLRSTHDDRLTTVLEPIISNAFGNLIKKKPKELATEIFPVLGAAIRRSIAETFHSMLLNFQKQMEISFSWRGLRWRLEALRTGKTFSEVVLLKTLVYRVDQVFLIHSQTGLVLTHLAHEGLATQDADLVSAMLTAVQDFVRDCFATPDNQDAELSSMNFGDGVILLEKHPYASLACLVRGTPPPEFRDQMASVLDTLLVLHAQDLADFSGDTAPFAEAQPYLEECLISRTIDEDKPLSVWMKGVPLILSLVLVLFLGGKYYDRMLERQASAERAAVLSESIESLRSSAGITIVEVRESDGPWEVYCLKDMLAPTPEAYLAEAGKESEDFIFHVTPVVSYMPEVVMTHVLQTIRPPESVAVRLDDAGVLHFTGTAPTGWQLQARTKALALSGVNDVDMSQVVDPLAHELKQLVQTIESTVIIFPFNKAVPVGDEHDKLVLAVDALVELEKLAKSMGMSVSLTVYGHADRVGSDRSNYAISQARVTTIASMLYGKGASIPLSLYAMGAEHAKQNEESDVLGDMASRRVELRVHLQQALEPQTALF